MRGVLPSWLGRLGYRWAWRLQHLRRDAVLAGHAPEAVWLLEHDPVLTTGRRPVAGLEGLGLPVVRTERGGLATWHGPGQLVGYVILDVAGRGGTVKGTVRAVEEGIASYLHDQGISAGRRAGYPGVWVGGDKICAVGLHFRRGVSMHGFALNVHPDLEIFSRFVPCGVTDGGVTSMAQALGETPAMHQAAGALAPYLVDTLELGG